jgi:probable HAF family extracellular repeat protein
MTKRLVLGLAALACLVSGAARARAEYIVTDLGTLGGFGSGARAINDSGQVVGYADTATRDLHAFLYSNGTMIDLNPPGSDLSSATSINAAGQVVGLSVRGNFLYSGGTFTTLPNGSGSSWARINNLGQIVGSNYATGDGLLYSGGKVTTLPLLTAAAINDAGQIAGTGFTTTGGQHAVLYKGGQITDLGTLGSQYSSPNAINASGQVVGYTYTPGANSPTHAFLYSNGKMIDLAGGNSYAFGVNDAGQVVGQSNGHAFLFSNGKLTDLNSLIPANSSWTLWSANAINNKGQIVGYGTNPSGARHAFLLTPVPAPEPTSLALLSLGALGLAGHAWRKRRRAARDRREFA